MKTCKRILAFFAFSLGLVGLLVSLALVVGVWVAKDAATSNVTKVFSRVDDTLGTVDKALVRVKSSLDNASNRLAAVKELQIKGGKAPAERIQSRRLLARSFVNEVAPELGDARGTFQNVADGVVVANNVMDNIGNYPLLSDSRMSSERLSEINTRLSQLEASALELSQLLSEQEPDSEAIGDQLSKANEALSGLRRLVSDFETPFGEVHQKVETLKTRIHAAIMIAAILITCIFGWVAISQISIMAHAWSLWRRQSIST
jgi:hypothetical protein